MIRLLKPWSSHLQNVLDADNLICLSQMPAGERKCFYGWKGAKILNKYNSINRWAQPYSAAGPGNLCCLLSEGVRTTWPYLHAGFSLSLSVH